MKIPPTDDGRQFLPDEPDDQVLITTDDVICTLGLSVYDKALAYGRHHTDAEGRPFWTAAEFEATFGLIEIEEKGRS